MAQQFQFGNRASIRSSDNLQHYRLEIQRLQQQNLLQAQAYTKKIQQLESQLKNPQSQPSHSASNPFPTYQSTGTINLQILKRDKQINKLSEQNMRLRKQAQINPDHELILKNKRSFFDELADKDAEIMRLKKCIYQFESKYDGKYFNDARIRNQYQMLQDENNKLKKQLETYSNASKPINTEINKQLLECIHYKKQAELLAKENQYLKAQYKKMDDEYSGYRNSLNGKVVVGTEIDLLKRELDDSHRKNQELLQYIKEIEGENSRLKTDLDTLRGMKANERDTMQRSSLGSNNGDSSRKRNRIFNHKEASEISESEVVQQYQPPQQMPSQITSKYTESPNNNIKGSLPATQKKAGYYDKYEIKKYSSRGSLVS